MRKPSVLLKTALLIAVLTAANAREWYVSPNGSPQGDGSINNPWDLQTALNGGPTTKEVQPGDIIWVRGGEYEGPFYCNLKGNQDKPIIVRSYPGERAILQVYLPNPSTAPSKPAQAVFNFGSSCQYVWLWGFEIRNHGIETRWTDITGSWPPGGMDGIYAVSSGIKIINNFIHDVMGNGIGFWRTAIDSELYGNIILNNGWKSSDRGHGHSVYTQNEIGTKYIIDDIHINPFGYSLHAYGSSRAFLKNFYFEGNVFMNKSALIGGLTSCPVENITFKNNFFWNTGPTFGYYGAQVTKDLYLEGNYLINGKGAGTARVQFQHWQKIYARKNKFMNLTSSGPPDEGYNRFIEIIVGPLGVQNYDFDENEYYYTPLWRFPKGYFLVTPNERIHDYPTTSEGFYWISWEYNPQYPTPTWRQSESPYGSLEFDPNGFFTGNRPTGTEIFIRPNKYEPGRAHIIVFNWDKLNKVSIDLSSVLPLGTPFEIRNAQDFLNDIVVSGIYNGGNVEIDMVNRTVATPIGWNEPIASSTFPEFGVFVLLPKYPSIPQVMYPHRNEKVSETPTFRLKAYDEFPIRFVIEITKDGQTSTYVTDYTESGTELTFTLPEPLLPGNYTVRVKAQDKYGRESPYTEPFSIIVKRPLSSPKLIEPADSLIVTPTPTFKVKAEDPEGKQVKFLIEVKQGEKAKVFETGLVESGEEAIFSVPPEQALTEGTYTWRAKARNEDGLESDWSEAWNFTVNYPPLAPTLISPEENAVVPSTPTFKLKADDPTGQRVRIRVEVLDEEGNILHQITTPEVDSGQEVIVSLSPDQALAPGTYYWRAVASDRWMESPFSETRSFRVFALSYQIPKGLSFISVPLRTDQPWAELLGLPEDQLRVVTWDTINNRYVHASAATASPGSMVGELAFRPHLGRGYWVKLDASKEIYIVGHKVEGEVAIDLYPGWNAIGNPFTKPILWDIDSIKVRRLGEIKSLRDARKAGWLEDYLWGWKPNSRNPDIGSYFLVYDEKLLPDSVPIVEPFNAYWIKANVPCQLILEPPETGKLTKLPRQRVKTGSGFVVCVNAELNGAESKAFIGIANGTRLLATEPPTPPTGKMLQVVVSSGEQELVADIREKASQRMMWELVVRWLPTRGQQGEISLSFDGIGSIPKGYSVFLVDKTTGKRVYLRTTPVYRFMPQEDEKERRFVLFLEQTGGGLLRIVNLKAQPMRGRWVAINFRLTKAAQTTAEILTLTGRTIVIVEAGQPRPAGEQQLFWRGTDGYMQPVGVGVYLVRVRAVGEEGQQTQAITIVRLR